MVNQHDCKQRTFFDLTKSWESSLASFLSINAQVFFMKLDMISLQVDRYVSKPAYLALKMVGFLRNLYPVYH